MGRLLFNVLAMVAEFLIHSGEYSTAEVAELFGVARSTVYRAIERQRDEARTVTTTRL